MHFVQAFPSNNFTQPTLLTFEPNAECNWRSSLPSFLSSISYFLTFATHSEINQSMRPHLFFPSPSAFFAVHRPTDRHALSNTLSPFPRSSFHRYCPSLSLERARYSSPDSPRRRRGKCQVRARRRSRIFGREIGHPRSYACVCTSLQAVLLSAYYNVGMGMYARHWLLPCLLSSFPPLRASGHTQIVLATRDCVCLVSLAVRFLAVLAVPHVPTNYLPVHLVKAILCRLLGSPSANMLT